MSMTDSLSDQSEWMQLNAEEPEGGNNPAVDLDRREAMSGGDVELSAEEVEEIIAPFKLIGSNHNETLVSEEPASTFATAARQPECSNPA